MNDAIAGRDDATGNTHDPKDAEVSVLPWDDQALQAGSRGRCPPLAQTVSWAVLWLGAFIGGVPLMLASGTSNRTPRTLGQSRRFHQARQEPMPEERGVHADHDGHQREHVKHDACLPSRRSTLLLEDRVAATQP